MIIPNAETIEGAVDSLLRLDPIVRNDELDELREGVGADAAAKMHVAFPLSPEFEAGFLLALEIARATVASSAEVLMHGADPAKVL